MNAQTQTNSTPFQRFSYGKFHVVLQPGEIVRTGRALYPPIIVRVVLPDALRDHTIQALPFGMYPDNRLRNGVLDDADAQWGRIVDDFIPNIPTSHTHEPGSTDNPNSSSEGSLMAEEGEHAMYFVFHNLSITRPGWCKIRLCLYNITDGNQYLGDVETREFHVERRSVQRQRPGKST
jgi:hypothetical protein